MTLGTVPMHEALAPQPVETVDQLADPAPAGASQELTAVRHAVLETDREFAHLERGGSPADESGLRDYVLASDDQPRDPSQIFERLRWGGQFVYVSADRREVRAMPE